MKVREITAKSILSRSRVYDYALNPYVGCAHGCVYCYARFMKRYTGHKEEWGDFVDVKINAPELVLREVQKKRQGRVWISGVCDPYQPLEEKYALTRRCLATLVEYGWPLTVQTKSPLVLRDIDILRKARECEVGFTVTTMDEKVRRIFEPFASPSHERIEALATLHLAGITTYAMIAPILPGTENLVGALKGNVDYVILDKLNYHYADAVCKAHGFPLASDQGLFLQLAIDLKKSCEKEGIPCQVVFK